MAEITAQSGIHAAGPEQIDGVLWVGKARVCLLKRRAEIGENEGGLGTMLGNFGRNWRIT